MKHQSKQSNHLVQSEELSYHFGEIIYHSRSARESFEEFLRHLKKLKEHAFLMNKCSSSLTKEKQT